MTVNEAVERGLKHGAYLAASADTTRLRQLAAEAQSYDTAAATQRRVSNALTTARTQVWVTTSRSSRASKD